MLDTKFSATKFVFLCSYHRWLRIFIGDTEGPVCHARKNVHQCLSIWFVVATPHIVTGQQAIPQSYHLQSLRDSVLYNLQSRFSTIGLGSSLYFTSIFGCFMSQFHVTLFLFVIISWDYMNDNATTFYVHTLFLFLSDFSFHHPLRSTRNQ